MSQEPPVPISPYSPPTPASGSTVSQESVLTHFRKEQNFPVALAAGAFAAVLGGLLWALITVSTHTQLGLMAIGVGFLVGFAVRLGKGIDKAYGYLGAILALFGCIVGNVFTIIGFISEETHLGILATLKAVDFSKLPGLLISTGSPIDLLFYLIAVIQGYKFSFRRITPEELQAAAVGL